MPVLWAFLAPVHYGIALIREGRAAEGIPPLKAGLAIWDAAGGKIWSPYAKSVLAEGMALTGELDNALQLIDEQIAQVEDLGTGLEAAGLELGEIEQGVDGAGEGVGVAVDPGQKGGELGTHLEARQTERSPRPPRPGVQLVHRRLRHEGPERGPSIVRGIRRVKGHSVCQGFTHSTLQRSKSCNAMPSSRVPPWACSRASWNNHCA